MKYIKAFRKAGEPTAAAPLYLCEIVYNSLKSWQHYHTVEDMSREISADIEALDRFEFLAIDEDNQVRAMLIATQEENPHHGDLLFTRYAFSAEPQTLAAGYRWLFKLSKLLDLNGTLYTKRIDDRDTIYRFKIND
ncbi:hypothetical protein EWD52_23460 [Salmonella enterica subsp. enterica serovar Braenderup]|nr:hypothetical protein [Salmonella enterica subsp. enterica serovar Braenderup]ECD1500257.1 hypothetical protein [Salmonella enterica subsp. enterica serovar Braenderup]